MPVTFSGFKPLSDTLQIFELMNGKNGDTGAEAHIFALHPGITQTTGHNPQGGFGSDRRLPGEYLLQGGVMTPLGDKSVHNCQWIWSFGASGDSACASEVAAYIGEIWKPLSIEGAYKKLVSPLLPIRVPGYSGRHYLAPNGIVEFEYGHNTTIGFMTVKAICVCGKPRHFYLDTSHAFAKHTGGSRHWHMSQQQYSQRYMRYSTNTISGIRDFNPSSCDYTDYWDTEDTEVRAEWVREQHKITLGSLDLSYLEEQCASETGKGPKIISWVHAGQLPQVPNFPDHVYERIHREITLLESAVVPGWSDGEWSDLSRACLENINFFSGNMAAYFSDLPRVGASIRAVLNLVRSYDNPKAWARAWLALRYSDRLTIRDTSELIQGALRSAQQSHDNYHVYRSRLSKTGSNIDALGRRMSWSSQITGTILLRGGLHGDLENLLAAPYRWDLLPTRENVWDMIPLSFVVDWFVDVSKLLDTLDKVQEVRLLDIKGEYASERLEVVHNIGDYLPGYSGSIRHIVYRRTPTKVSSLMKLSFDGSDLSIPSLLQTADGLALIGQCI